jgi:hypothetical protein
MGRKATFVLRLAVLVALLGALTLSGGAWRPGEDGSQVAAAHDRNGDNKGGNQNRCIGGTASTTTVNGTLVQTCTITARRGTCIQRSNKPVVKQVCTFTQQPPLTGGPARENRAKAIQVVQARRQQGKLDATQEIVVLQRNTTRNNIFKGTQIIEQCLVAGTKDGGNDDDNGGDDDNGHDDDNDDNGGNGNCENGNGARSLTRRVLQNQESQQSIEVCQGGPMTLPGEACDDPSGGGMLASNKSLARQRTDLTEIAVNAPSIAQLQNREDRANECTIETGLDDVFSDTCYTVRQNTAGGHARNITRLHQDFDLSQRAKDTETGEQLQGRLGRGGLEHVFVQNSSDPGKSTQFSDGDKRWKQIRRNTGLLVWEQHDRHSKGTGIQRGSAANRALMNQDSILNSVGPGEGEQTAVLVIFCDSSAPPGNCTGRQRAVVNGVEQTNFESAPVITMAIVCGDVDVFPVVPGDVGIRQEDGGICAPVETSFEPPGPSE